MTAGEAADRDNTCTYNCSYIALDGPNAMKELCYILMNGTGVGFSVEESVVDQWPRVPDGQKLMKKLKWLTPRRLVCYLRTTDASL